MEAWPIKQGVPLKAVLLCRGAARRGSPAGEGGVRAMAKLHVWPALEERSTQGHVQQQSLQLEAVRKRVVASAKYCCIR